MTQCLCYTSTMLTAFEAIYYDKKKKLQTVHWLRVMKYLDFARMTKIILLKSSYKRNRRRLSENRLRRTSCKLRQLLFFLVIYNTTVIHMSDDFDVPFANNIWPRLSYLPDINFNHTLIGYIVRQCLWISLVVVVFPPSILYHIITHYLVRSINQPINLPI